MCDDLSFINTANTFLKFYSPPPHKLEGGGACHPLHMYLLILALESYIFSGRNKYVNIMLRNILSCIKSLNFDLVVKLGAVISFPLVFS